MTLTFDEMSHTYRWNDVVVPSVTQVLRFIDGMEHAPVDRVMVAGIRGTLVHKATEVYDKGGTPTLVDETRPYFEAYLAFLSDYRNELGTKGQRWESIEERLIHPLLQYAGTADRVGVIYGERAVLDIKTSARLAPAVGAQLAGYRAALNERRVKKDRVIRRYALQLRRDGKYDLREYSDDQDMHIFRACLDIYRWREANGLGDYRARAQPEPQHELLLTRATQPDAEAPTAPTAITLYGRKPTQ